MYLDSAKKQEIFSQYGKSNTDTGSCESQIALFSYRISRLTEHMKANHKDYSTLSVTAQLLRLSVCVSNHFSQTRKRFRRDSSQRGVAVSVSVCFKGFKLFKVLEVFRV